MLERNRGIELEVGADIESFFRSLSSCDRLDAILSTCLTRGNL